MRAIASISTRVGLALLQIGVLLTLLYLGGCGASRDRQPGVKLQLYQSWQLQPGDAIAGYSVLGGLGDISIALNNKPVYAPFPGRTERDTRNCVLFSSPEVPAYMFRLCGLSHPQFGELKAGSVIGSGASLQIATLRKQPTGTWALVEPSNQLLERFLTSP